MSGHQGPSVSYKKGSIAAHQPSPSGVIATARVSTDGAGAITIEDRSGLIASANLDFAQAAKSATVMLSRSFRNVAVQACNADSSAPEINVSAHRPDPADLRRVDVLFYDTSGAGGQIVPDQIAVEFTLVVSQAS